MHGEWKWLRRYVAKQRNKRCGREMEFATVDSDSDRSKATDSINKLIKRNKLDVLIGPVRYNLASWPRPLRTPTTC